MNVAETYACEMIDSATGRMLDVNVVGGDDIPVIGMNREAYDQMKSVRRLEIVPGASHLFEEAGTLEEVARLAGEWFQRYLR